MKTVYIYCPAASYTGGPTLAHQLCYSLNKIGLKAFMWYDCNFIKKFYIDPVHDSYKHFENLYVTKTPRDSKDIVIVALESNVAILRNFNLAKRFIWWMSVDNFFLNMGNTLDRIKNRFGLYHPSVDYCKKYEFNQEYSVYKEKDIIHLVQSEYARLFLLNREINVDCIIDLGDYLEDEILEIHKDLSLVRSDSTVLYNPKKGFEFTSKLIEAAPHLEWLPLINMSKKEIIEKLKNSKLYIDFGNHPGKDRFPREAVICGCCVITGKQGSAYNDIDIPIPSKYKFADNLESVHEIVCQIEIMLKEYHLCKKDFHEYIAKIMVERNHFENQVMNIFSDI